MILLFNFNSKFKKREHETAADQQIWLQKRLKRDRRRTNSASRAHVEEHTRDGRKFGLWEKVILSLAVRGEAASGLS